jgi:hypothetical protein
LIIAHIEGATRVLGKSQGYIGLPVRDDVEFDKASGQNVHSMTTAWQPTPAEMAAIAAGAPIEFTIFCQHAFPAMAGWPPCRMTVGKVPE